MIHPFQYQINNGHFMIVENDLHILIDTGSPINIAREITVQFLGAMINCSTDFGGKPIDYIGELAGHRIDVLLGAPTLSNYHLVFAPSMNRMAFITADEDIQEMHSIGFGLTLSLPVVDFEMNGRKGRAFLDTGARLSYLHSAWLSGMNSIGEEPDFHPSIGRFNTQVYPAELSIAERPFAAKLGQLPPAFENAFFNAHNIQGIIGYDLFANKSILLSYPKKLLIFPEKPIESFTSNEDEASSPISDFPDPWNPEKPKVMPGPKSSNLFIAL